MSDCIFCRISKKEIPNYTVYEDDFVLSFLDIHPCVIGHTVVIPKQHSSTILDLEDALYAPLFLGVKRATERVHAALKPDGFNIGWNHGKAGGQAVGHLHVHILPRWYTDGGGSMHSIVRDTGDMSVEEVAKLFH